MANIEITNNKTSTIVVWEPVFEDDSVTFAGAATLKAGTMLSRDSSSLKLVPYVKGAGTPKAVLRDELTADGAGDVRCRPIISGRVRKADLVIHADGDASNVDAAVVDQLRNFTIIALGTTQLAELDNQ